MNAPRKSRGSPPASISTSTTPSNATAKAPATCLNSKTRGARHVECAANPARRSAGTPVSLGRAESLNPVAPPSMIRTPSRNQQTRPLRLRAQQTKPPLSIETRHARTEYTPAIRRRQISPRAVHYHPCVHCFCPAPHYRPHKPRHRTFPTGYRPMYSRMAVPPQRLPPTQRLRARPARSR